MNKSEVSRAVPLRFSALKHFAKSPAHYYHAITAERTDSRAMRLGRAIHAIVLGGKCDVFDGSDRRAKGWAEFERNAKSETVLTAPEFFEARRIAQAVKDDAGACAALSGRKEELLETSLDGRALRGTPDAFHADALRAELADLKSTQCADPAVFSRHAAQMLYPNQLAWYRMLVKMVHGVDIRTFRLVAVETSAPHNVTVLNVPLDMVEEAHETNMSWFKRLLECEATGEFPGYSGGRVIEMERRPTMNIVDLAASQDSDYTPPFA